MEREIKFEDAQALHKQHPDTFDAPTSEQLRQLKAGNLVKVCVLEEHFWAEVISVEAEVITARVDNILLMDELSFNDTISFKKENIYDILLAEALRNRPPKPKTSNKPRRKF